MPLGQYSAGILHLNPFFSALLAVIGYLHRTWSGKHTSWHTAHPGPHKNLANEPDDIAHVELNVGHERLVGVAGAKRVICLLDRVH